MSCCGGKRRALTHAHAAAPSVHAAVTRTAAQDRLDPPRVPDVRLRYLGGSPFSARSTRTGRLYACSGTRPGLSVDRLDVESLLLTRLFAR